ncbi:ribosomal RNA adenine methylase transferase [Purpureocillium lavendulum]|uniref:Mitochondrial transcription factor 1 n=1 Tax=Purpureocillium lavendulum TaxID=1247861 RepID=A0AB34FQZ6_9HYPO|nr:ribosomal RNA adenine methylase transferase [Purpureocillium lavendulum]
MQGGSARFIPASNFNLTSATTATTATGPHLRGNATATKAKSAKAKSTKATVTKARATKGSKAAVTKATVTKPKPKPEAPASEIARRLEQTGVWQPNGGRKKAAAAAEPWRVNVVSEGLCDDILRYVGPSLERHRGCDLVDLNPGAGVWSRKLHELLQPRRHVMMEPDAELYRPFLAPLLAKDGVCLLPQSGIVWSDLRDVMRTQLADQRETAPGEAATPARNDTLLVTANLSTFPKRAFHGFDSLSTMVMYQLMSHIRTAAHFQGYGLVRMLLWVNDEDKRRLLPRAVTRRKRAAFEAELSCEWIHEVAGLDADVEDRNALRDEWINVESGCRAVERMAAQGLTMPAGRETAVYKRLAADPALMGQRLAGVRPPTVARPFKEELQDLEHGLAAGDDASKRLKALRQRDKYDQGDTALYLDLLREHEAVAALSATSSSPAEFARADAAWNQRIAGLKKNARNEFNVFRDSLHLFRQDPPALLWDRRAYEPLAARADDFFPAAPSALLDIQPKATHPLLRQHGEGTSRSGDISEMVLGFWFQHSLQPLDQAMARLWPGFGDLAARCPSLHDPARGGTPVTGRGAVTVRAMNEAQWTEILQAYMGWSFRPSYVQLVAHLTVDENDDVDDDGEVRGGAGGLA